MAKGKFKELIFDINTNSFIDIDENNIKEENIEVAAENDGSILQVSENNTDIDVNEDFKEDKEEQQKSEMSSFFDKKINERKLNRDRVLEDRSENLKDIETLFAESEDADGNSLEEINEKLKEKFDLFLGKAKNSFSTLSEKASGISKDLSKSTIKRKEEIGSIIKENSLKDKIKLPKKVDKSKLSIIGILGSIFLLIFWGMYLYRFFKLPNLEDKHIYIEKTHKNLGVEVHPMQILSTVLDNMKEYKGEPQEKGDGKTLETRYVVYSLGWFGKNRKTVLFYNSQREFYRIKLDIGNDSAKYLYEKLNEELGIPVEENNPLNKQGYAIWIKDSIKYKMIHRGSFTTIEMSISEYDNKSNLPVGKNPVLIQYFDADINDDGKDDKIMLLGNRENSLTTKFSKLYLVIWDNNKTNISEMDSNFEGGEFPRMKIEDTNDNKYLEVEVISENNVIDNYNIFEYKDGKVERIYSGHEVNKSNEQ